MNARFASVVLALALTGCPRAHSPADAGAAPPPADVERVPAVAEIPAMGPSADGQEVDVPLSWIHLLAEPAPTGGTPYAVVGATVPCGFVPRYTVSERGDGEVRLRMRAQRRVTDGVRCEHGTPVVELVSLSLLRLGAWRVVDAVAHGEHDVPAPTPRTIHVVPDDATLPPTAECWTRPCATTADCTSGGLCARVGTGSICLPPIDPWLGLNRACPDGTRATEVTPIASGEGVAWRACVAACDPSGHCAGRLRCEAGICLPSSRVDAGTFSADGGLRTQGRVPVPR